MHRLTSHGSIIPPPAGGRGERDACADESASTPPEQSPAVLAWLKRAETTARQRALLDATPTAAQIAHRAGQDT